MEVKDGGKGVWSWGCVVYDHGPRGQDVARYKQMNEGIGRW